MNKVLNNNKLEQLLLKNWANILDVTQLLSFVMSEVRDAENFEIIEEDNLPNKPVEITLSRFHFTKDGFVIWVDFTIPQPKGFSIGTLEALISPIENKLTTLKIAGQVLKQH